jgi:hypothetical protein
MHTARTVSFVAAAAVAALASGGCKFAELPPVEEQLDAAADHLVGGTVDGLWSGASLTLRLESDGAPPQLLTITTGEGPFVFPARVAVGATLNLALESPADQHACAVTTPSGQVQGRDIDTLHVDCTADIAVSVVLSSMTPFTFDPQVSQQRLNVSILQGQMGFTPMDPPVRR